MPVRTLSRRDTLLVFLGAGCMQAFSWFRDTTIAGGRELLCSAPAPSFRARATGLVIPSLAEQDSKHADTDEFPSRDFAFAPAIAKHRSAPHSPLPVPAMAEQMLVLPETFVLSSVPGWTIFKDVYMSNGTLFIVSDQPASTFPEPRLMISTGLPGFNEPANIAAREPSKYDMAVITSEEARKRWGGSLAGGSRNNVRTVEGNTFMVADPDQFLNHYYHFAGELLFGGWAFWHGTFSDTTPSKTAPLFDRLIFSHTNHKGWRDIPGFNHYWLRAAFPSIVVETVDDWEDRIALTVPPSPDIPPPNYADAHSEPQEQLVAPPLEEQWAKVSGFRGAEIHREPNSQSRAWHFPTLLLADRSAAHRGWWCGAKTQRTASEALVKMRELKKIDDGREWWERIRRPVVEYAGGDPSPHDGQQPIVITYISRQGSRRRLIQEHHERLVNELQTLVARKNFEAPIKGGQSWELNVVQAQKLTKDEQIRLASKTTILLGVHGNGLTHLILMPPSKYSAVVEIFYPGGWAHDYEWTASYGLNMSYYGITNDTYQSAPESYDTYTAYPEGFHGTDIPVDARVVRKVIEGHILRVEPETTLGGHYADY